MRYYILKDDDIIMQGDEWTIDDIHPIWKTVTGSVGYTVEGWDDYNNCKPGWRVRRKIKLTKLGDSL